MTDTRTTIRGLDPDVYHDIRILAVDEHKTVGQIMSELLRDALSRRTLPPPQERVTDE